MCIRDRLLAEGEGLTSNYAYMPVTFDEAVFGESRDEVMSRLAAEGIGARKYFYPLVSDYACYRETYHSSETPVARDVYKRQFLKSMPAATRRSFG